MTTHEERQRVAAMGNALRPDWNIRSLYTLLTDEEVLVKRAYRELVKAAADCWTDPATKTPKRLIEPGPWWTAPTAGKSPRQTVNVTGRCDRCGGLHHPDDECDPPEHARSRGRGAQAAKQALRQALTGD